MNTRAALILAALAALGLAAAHPAAAQTTITLQNGGFSGNNGSDTVYNFTGSQSYYYAYGNHNASQGNDLFINGGSVYQLLGTTGTAGETLTLNGFYENYNGAIPASSQLEFTTAAPTSTNDLASGSVLVSESLAPNIPSNRQPFAPLTYTTTVANQSIYLVIGGPDIATYGQYGKQSNYAAFSLTDVPGPAVSAAPEPSQLAGLGFTAFGVLGLALKARKRKADHLAA